MSCLTCGLDVLPKESAVLLVLPDEPFCCCDDPLPITPGVFYDGAAFYDGTMIYNSTIA